MFFVLAFANTSCGQKPNSPKKEPARTEKRKNEAAFHLRNRATRDSLVKLFADSIFVDMSLRDAAIREIFEKPVHWDAGEFVATSNTLQIPRKPLGWTTDYEGIFTSAQIDTLNAIISQFERETTNEIAVVTIDRSWTTKEKFDSSILTLANHWGVGKESKNNGVLIGLSAGLRRIRISNGYGIVSKLSDSETKKIIENTIIPYFKEDTYFEGVRQGLLAIMEKLR
jgi:uncharacterized protein